MAVEDLSYPLVYVGDDSLEVGLVLLKEELHHVHVVCRAHSTVQLHLIRYCNCWVHLLQLVNRDGYLLTGIQSVEGQSRILDQLLLPLYEPVLDVVGCRFPLILSRFENGLVSLLWNHRDDSTLAFGTLANLVLLHEWRVLLVSDLEIRGLLIQRVSHLSQIHAVDSIDNGLAPVAPEALLGESLFVGSALRRLVPATALSLSPLLEVVLTVDGLRLVWTHFGASYMGNLSVVSLMTLGSRPRSASRVQIEGMRPESHRFLLIFLSHDTPLLLALSFELTPCISEVGNSWRLIVTALHVKNPSVLGHNALSGLERPLGEGGLEHVERLLIWTAVVVHLREDASAFLHNLSIHRGIGAALSASLVLRVVRSAFVVQSHVVLEGHVVEPGPFLALHTMLILLEQGLHLLTTPLLREHLPRSVGSGWTLSRGLPHDGRWSLKSGFDTVFRVLVSQVEHRLKPGLLRLFQGLLQVHIAFLAESSN